MPESPAGLARLESSKPAAYRWNRSTDWQSFDWAEATGSEPLAQPARQCSATA